MPNWFTKLADKVGLDDVVDKFEDVMDNVEEFTDVNWVETFKLMKESSVKCRELAGETSAMCEQTESKGDAMVDFGAEISGTLGGFGSDTTRDIDISFLDTIKDLTDGGKVESAMALAQEIEELAVGCVDKSVEMTTILDDTMDALPEPVQRAILSTASEDEKEEEEELRELMELDGPIQDVKDCIEALQDFNLSTAIQVGSHAFETLSAKAKVSKSLFLYIRQFSDDVKETLEGFAELDLVNLKDNGKHLLKSIRLSGLMKQLAELAGTLMKMLIELFHSIADRVSTLWEALAYCKEVMTECLEYVHVSRNLCMEVQEKSTTLTERGISIKDQLEGVGDLTRSSAEKIQTLKESGEIEESIGVAQNMDTTVEDCSNNVLLMVNRVTEGFHKLPEIITQDMDIVETGRNPEDPEPLDIEEDIQQLVKAKEEIEEANIVEAARSAAKGYAGVLSKLDNCKEILKLLNHFAQNCRTVIEDFMDVWNIETMQKKLDDLCRVVSCGELMKQWALQVKRLLDASIDLMTATSEKLTLDYDELADDLAEHAVDAVADKINDIIPGENFDISDEVVDAVADKIGDGLAKMKFW